MLVLSRKPNQSVTIGENIKVTIVRIRGNVVSLGIEAPQSVRVMREELVNRESKTLKIMSEEIADKSKLENKGEVQPEKTRGEGTNEIVDEIEIFADMDTPLTDLDEMLYSPEDFADRCRFSNPLAAFMFAP